MDPKEFLRRRKQLMNMMGDNSIAILPTAHICMRNRDIEYPFRPDSDFYYLTGFSEPEAVAVLIPGRSKCEYVLFCRANDVEKELWEGRRTGLAGACTIYGADDAFPIEDIDDILPRLLENKERIYYNIGHDAGFDQRLLTWVNQIYGRTRTGVHAPDTLTSLNHFLHEMRLYKSRQEIQAMRRAAKLSAAAHTHVMQHCRPEMTEHQIEAMLIYEFMRRGARALAYPCIVGGGENSCILHYTANTATLQNGDLLLIDAGAELAGYASDISRTFPVSGIFTKAQRTIYELVLAAQQAAIEKVKPGNNWNDPHMAAVDVITRGLIALGILRGKVSDLIKKQAYKKYYMHHTGHWLGMDVHDVGDYKVDGAWRTLAPGMVLTIEPGLYLRANTSKLAKKWWNIGVRIEDDVLVTKNGYEILSKDAPKTPDEIEQLMAHAA